MAFLFGNTFENVRFREPQRFTRHASVFFTVVMEDQVDVRELLVALVVAFVLGLGDAVRRAVGYGSYRMLADFARYTSVAFVALRGQASSFARCLGLKASDGLRELADWLEACSRGHL